MAQSNDDLSDNYLLCGYPYSDERKNIGVEFLNDKSVEIWKVKLNGTEEGVGYFNESVLLFHRYRTAINEISIDWSILTLEEDWSPFMTIDRTTLKAKIITENHNTQCKLVSKEEMFDQLQKEAVQIFEMNEEIRSKRQL